MLLYRSMVLCMSLLLIAGCQKDEPHNPMGMDFRDTYGPKQPVIQDAKGHRPVAVGKPPLAYMVDVQASVRIMNTATNEQLATAPVKAGTVVAVDKEEGIYVGEKIIRPGPLDADVKYGIYIDVK